MGGLEPEGPANAVRLQRAPQSSVGRTQAREDRSVRPKPSRSHPPPREGLPSVVDVSEDPGAYRPTLEPEGWFCQTIITFPSGSLKNAEAPNGS